MVVVKKPGQKSEVVTLKAVAQHLGLTPGTVSAVLNDSPSARSIPTDGIAGHKKLKGVTNIVLDHHKAAVLALNHLKDLRHERIAFMKGNPVSSDAKDRWDAICQVAGQIGMNIDPELTVQIDADDPTPMLGYPFAKQLLARGKPFTAIF